MRDRNEYMKSAHMHLEFWQKLFADLASLHSSKQDLPTAIKTPKLEFNAPRLGKEIEVWDKLIEHINSEIKNTKPYEPEKQFTATEEEFKAYKIFNANEKFKNFTTFVDIYERFIKNAKAFFDLQENENLPSQKVILKNILEKLEIIQIDKENLLKSGKRNIRKTMERVNKNITKKEALNDLSESKLQYNNEKMKLDDIKRLIATCKRTIKLSEINERTSVRKPNIADRVKAARLEEEMQLEAEQLKKKEAIKNPTTEVESKEKPTAEVESKEKPIAEVESKEKPSEIPLLSGGLNEEVEKNNATKETVNNQGKFFSKTFADVFFFEQFKKIVIEPLKSGKIAVTAALKKPDDARITGLDKTINDVNQAIIEAKQSAKDPEKNSHEIQFQCKEKILRAIEDNLIPYADDFGLIHNQHVELLVDIKKIFNEAHEIQLQRKEKLPSAMQNNHDVKLISLPTDNVFFKNIQAAVILPIEEAKKNFNDDLYEQDKETISILNQTITEINLVIKKAQTEIENTSLNTDKQKIQLFCKRDVLKIIDSNLAVNKEKFRHVLDVKVLFNKANMIELSVKLETPEERYPHFRKF